MNRLLAARIEMERAGASVTTVVAIAACVALVRYGFQIEPNWGVLIGVGAVNACRWFVARRAMRRATEPPELPPWLRRTETGYEDLR